MKIIGIVKSVNKNGEAVFTLHCTDAFAPYENDAEKGKSAVGVKTQSVYAGTYDCSKIKLGSEIEIYYDRAITTTSGTFQTIKKIEVVSQPSSTPIRKES